MQGAIADNAYRRELDRNEGHDIVVGVNKYIDNAPSTTAIQRIDQDAVQRQIDRVAAYKAQQDHATVDAALDAVGAAANGSDNLLPVMKQALIAGATLGQICDRLRAQFGEHRPNS
jgi:methylmalonyl-CoA mutase N-terminal domain/subunit